MIEQDVSTPLLPPQFLDLMTGSVNIFRTLSSNKLQNLLACPKEEKCPRGQASLLPLH
jgi:hypothetical protein